MRKPLVFGLLVIAGGLLLLPSPAGGQGFVSEETTSYEVAIVIEPSGSILVTETIAQSFGSTARHGIFRDIPNRLRYDDTYDRVYPIEVVSVSASEGTPAGFETFEENGTFRIRIGDPDRSITGEHTYEIVYRVRGAMNGFDTHDELYWNAIGTGWEQSIVRARVRVQGPAPITRTACFVGPFGSTLECGRSQLQEGVARFQQENLPPFNALSVVIALPPGTVESTAPILSERWSLDRGFSRTPLTVGGSAGLLAIVLGGLGTMLWRRGRDVRYRGSQLEQVLGSGTASREERSVPLLEKGTAPVEFAPPDDLRPGQVGTLIDEEANTLDVTATIVDLAVRKHLVIEEIEKKGWFSKPDWKLTKLPRETDDLLQYERTLLAGLFEDGDEIKLSDLKKKFVERLQKVKDAIYNDATRRRWFYRRPDKVRQTWVGIGTGAFVLGIGATVALAAWTKLGLLGFPLIAGGLLLLSGAKFMPRRTAKGTALTRRVNGFRQVIEKAETYQARWAEQENVFTRYLPFAIVFGCTEKWAETFEALAQGAPGDDMRWYVSSRPFAYGEFGERMDAFSVTTSGTIASTPAGSGGSGFSSGGGFSGGGGGGGGGGSW